MQVECSVSTIDNNIPTLSYPYWILYYVEHDLATICVKGVFVTLPIEKVTF